MEVQSSVANACWQQQDCTHVPKAGIGLDVTREDVMVSQAFFLLIVEE